MNASTISQWIIGLITEVRETIQFHSLADRLPQAELSALILLAGGLLLGIFGAAYARGIISTALAAGGFFAGMNIAQHYNVTPLVGGVVGLLVLAAIGYYTFRMWVGVAVGLLVSTVIASLYGHDTLWPDFRAYEPQPLVQSPPQLLSVEEQQEYRNPTPRGYFTGFYDEFSANRPGVARNLQLMFLLTAIGGFVVGALWTRFALVLACAAVGTGLFGSSLATFAEALAPQGWEQRIGGHPQILLGFVAASFLLSVLVQYRMTRPTKFLSALS